MALVVSREVRLGHLPIRMRRGLIRQYDLQCSQRSRVNQAGARVPVEEPIAVEGSEHVLERVPALSRSAADKGVVGDDDRFCGHLVFETQRRARSREHVGLFGGRSWRALSRHAVAGGVGGSPDCEPSSANSDINRFFASSAAT